jgi:molecular chaperone GrpE
MQLDQGQPISSGYAGAPAGAPVAPIMQETETETSVTQKDTGREAVASVPAGQEAVASVPDSAFAGGASLPPEDTDLDIGNIVLDVQAKLREGAPADLAAALRDAEARIVEAEVRSTMAEARTVEAEAQLAEQRNILLRSKAEAENVRRRSQEEVAKASKFASERFAGAMLPVKDSLEAALATENQTLEKLREGVELTLRQLIAAFDGASLAEEDPLGQKFDPNKHQAIGTLESEAEPNTVIDVLQKGYLLHGRVIRPAMVMVARAKA